MLSFMRFIFSLINFVMNLSQNKMVFNLKLEISTMELPWKKKPNSKEDCYDAKC